MLFNSLEYILVFLPLVITVFCVFNRFDFFRSSILWLVIASLYFYGYWNPIYIPLLIFSIITNFGFGKMICNSYPFKPKVALAVGVAFNIILLSFYKYMDFIIDNINLLLQSNLQHQNITLPLGISFFSFTQIAFLVDCYRNKVTNYSITNYSLFVTYFPHLLAGPIIHHKEMMPQFEKIDNKRLNLDNIRNGGLLFCIGLCKKILVADTLAIWANSGFNNVTGMTFFVAWCTSLCYTFQIYFDFSGYTDMALGTSKMFNIELPINFNSPYKALNPQDFWRRWHITLSRFLRDYLYIPLGGNQKGEIRTVLNVIITFSLGGLWHGAGWTFLFWGLLNGIGVVVFRLWCRTRIVMPKALAWLLTFNFVNICWIFFRARTLEDAFKIIKGMAGIEGFVLPEEILSFLPLFFHKFITGLGKVANLADGSLIGFVEMSTFIIFSFMIVTLFKNSQEMSPRAKKVVCISTFALCVQKLVFSQVASEFLYFRF